MYVDGDPGASRNLLTVFKTFDAVIVASGHYHTPLIPSIPGLAEAKSRWPSRTTHSKSFRSSRGFEQKVRLALFMPLRGKEILRSSPLTCSRTCS